MSDNALSYLLTRIEKRGGLTKAAQFYGISYHTLYSVAAGRRSLGEKTIKAMMEADSSLSINKLRAIKATGGSKAA
jgi:hypothetical protein